MKILYIDPICPIGHVNFNKIHINAIYIQYGNIDVIFESGYKQLFDGMNLSVVHEYPKIIVPNNGFWNRIKIWRNLKNIKRHIDFNSYDIIILSYYDELVLNLISFNHKLYLINHNNVAGVFKSFVKRIAYKRISQKNVQIVLDKLSKSALNKLGINYVQCVNHGLITPFKKEEIWDISVLNIPKKYKNIIFSPSAGSSDVNLIKKIIKNPDFISFLRKTDTIFLFRNDGNELEFIDNSNIFILKNRLNNRDYQNLFCRSNIILIFYPESFKYRTSGIVMEAFANNKDILLPDISTFKIYSEILDKDDYYTSSIDLINKLIKKVKYKNSFKLRDFSSIRIPDYSFFKDDFN